MTKEGTRGRERNKVAVSKEIQKSGILLLNYFDYLFIFLFISHFSPCPPPLFPAPPVYNEYTLCCSHRCYLPTFPNPNPAAAYVSIGVNVFLIIPPLLPPSLPPCLPSSFFIHLPSSSFLPSHPPQPQPRRCVGIIRRERIPHHRIITRHTYIVRRPVLLPFLPPCLHPPPRGCIPLILIVLFFLFRGPRRRRRGSLVIFPTYVNGVDLGL